MKKSSKKLRKKSSKVKSSKRTSSQEKLIKDKIKKLKSFTLLHTEFKNPSQFGALRVSRLRKNPGGGWVFIGRFANKWDGIRGKNVFDDILSRSGEFYVQLRDKKDGAWYIALVNRNRVPFDNRFGLDGMIEKGDNIIEVQKIFSEVTEILEFTGIGANEWEDLRIGYQSRGPELLNKKDRSWYAVNSIMSRNGKINVIDVRYKLSAPMYPVGF